MQDAVVSIRLIADSVWAAVPVALILTALRPTSAKSHRLFQERFGLQPAPDLAGELPRSLDRVRVFRLIGAAIGLSVDPLLGLAGAHPPALGLLWGLTGYLAGEVLATAAPRRAAAGARRASLTPRRPTNYLSRVAFLTPLAAVGIALVADTVYAFEPRRLYPPFSGTALAIVPTALAAAVTYGAIGIVVHRRQPVTSAGLVALDDALRAQCAHSAAAIGGAVALFGAGLCLLQMGGYAVPIWLHIGGGVLGLISMVLAVAVWGFRSTSWHVERVVTA